MTNPSIVVFGLSSLLSLVMLVWLTLFALDAGHLFGAVGILAIVAANTVFLGGFAVFLTPRPPRARSRSRRWRARRSSASGTTTTMCSWSIFRTTPSHPDMSAVFSSWVPRAPGEPGKPIPVIVAAAEGGGIRAAYWTSMVLHHLADIPDADVMFPRRLFAISSVSGGSFGAAVYAGLRRDPTSTPPRAQIASAILAGAVPGADGRQVGIRRSAAVVPAGPDPRASIDRARWRRRLPRPTTSTCITTRWWRSSPSFGPSMPTMCRCCC